MKSIIGEQVKHKTFGVGEVKEVNEDKIVISFNTVGEKQLKYPDVFEAFLKLDDEDLQNEMIAFSKEKKQERAAQEKRDRERAEERRMEEKRKASEDKRKRGIPSKTILNKGDKFSTHVEAINSCFGFNYEEYYPAYKVIDEQYAVWFPSIAKRVNGEYAATKTSAGWINVLSDNDTMLTECNEDARRNVVREAKYEIDRFVFAKFNEGEYVFIGVYRPIHDRKNLVDGYRYELIGTSVDLLTMEIK